MTPDEFVAQQTQFAATLRTNILDDPTASSSLQILAADPTNWTDLYLAALTQAGLLRPEDQPPEVHDNPVLVSLQDTLAAGILAGPAGKQIITSGNLVEFFNQVQQVVRRRPDPAIAVHRHRHRYHRAGPRRGRYRTSRPTRRRPATST